MTYFLRNNRNQTVVSVSFAENDFTVTVNVRHFAECLLDATLNSVRKADLVIDMEGMQNLRQEWFEIGKTPQYVSANEFVKDRMIRVGRKWNLSFV